MHINKAIEHGSQNVWNQFYRSYSDVLIFVLCILSFFYKAVLKV